MLPRNSLTDLGQLFFERGILGGGGRFLYICILLQDLQLIWTKFGVGTKDFFFERSSLGRGGGILHIRILPQDTLTDLAQI